MTDLYRLTCAVCPGPIEVRRLATDGYEYAHGPCVGRPDVEIVEMHKSLILEAMGIDVVHVVWNDGLCRVSLNGQGHFHCLEHNPK